MESIPVIQTWTRNDDDSVTKEVEIDGEKYIHEEEVKQILKKKEAKARKEEINHLINTDKEGLNWRVEALRRLSKLKDKE
jgi:hypothetical protein